MTITQDREERRINPVAAFELRDVEVIGKGTKFDQLSGIAVPYGVRTNIGWFDEEVKRGALKKSIAEAARSLPLLAFHDAASLPIGVAKEWHEESAGLRGVWKLEQDERSQQLARMAQPDEDGHAAMGYMSVRFIPMQSSWTYAQPGSNTRDYVLRTEARLVEVSLVSTPAYAGAHVQWVRTADPALRSEARGSRLRGYEEMLDKLRAGPQL